jgi:uncharacterized protein
MMVKKIFFSIMTFFFLFVGAASALDVPGYKGRVNDFAGMLKSDQIVQLEKKLEQYEKETSNQIAILAIPSLEGEDLEGFSIRVTDKWKVGQKGKDNGILILIAFKDRKMRIEVGKGLEGSLTDLISGRIIDSVMAPAFKEKAYYKGLDDAINSIQLAIKGEFKADKAKDATKSRFDNTEMYMIVYGMILFVAGIVGMFHWTIGGAAGGAGSYLATSWLFHPTLGILTFVTVIGILIGCIAKFILEIMLESSGGSYSGSGFSSSGSSGGGFSFGGGDFGGGGASGGW